MEQLSLRGADGMLAADAMGPEGAPTLLFLHGSGQTRQSWSRALAAAAERGYRALALDLRGHGDSAWSADGVYTMDRFTADLRAVLTQIQGPPVLIGASLGGIISMTVAAAEPSAARALVLVDIVPKVELEGVQEVVAFMSSAPEGYASLEAAAAAVAAYLPQRSRPANPQGLLRNLRQRGGRYHWHWDPAFMQMGRDAEGRVQVNGPNPMQAAARALSIPTLLVRGGRSRVVSEEGAREFLRMVPHAEYADIAGAHHMVVGDANDAFNDAVFRFVDRQLRPDGRGS